ncbi:MAG: hypothetical protein S4CHLAM102_14260 [Chlamydiia bacterium]|nr:hypothetical protein [Chlamydiia bacterium]
MTIICYDAPKFPFASGVLLDTSEQMPKELLQSLHAQFSDWNYFHRHLTGEVIVIVGTSTAGKTSIMNAFKQLAPEFTVGEGDRWGEKEDLNLLREYFPNQLSTLAHYFPLQVLPRVIYSGQRPWKKEIDPEEAKTIERLILHLKQQVCALPVSKIAPFDRAADLGLFDHAFEHARRGGNIIIDALAIEGFAKHAMWRRYNGHLTVALAYCPFSILPKRIAQRNQQAVETGELTERRIGTFPFCQFSNLYVGQKEKPMPSPSLEIITRSEASRIYTQHYDQWIEANQTADAPLSATLTSVAAKKEKCATFLFNLGFTDGVDQISILPHRLGFYHTLLNTGKVSAMQGAQHLFSLRRKGVLKRHH